MNRPAPVDISTEGNDKLIMSGVTGDCDSIKGAVKFQAQVKIETEGGSVSSTDTQFSCQQRKCCNALYFNCIEF